MARSPIDDHHRGHMVTCYDALLRGGRLARPPSTRPRPPPSLLLGRGGEREAAAWYIASKGSAAQQHKRKRWMMATSTVAAITSLRFTLSSSALIPQPPQLVKTWIRAAIRVKKWNSPHQCLIEVLHLKKKARYLPLIWSTLASMPRCRLCFDFELPLCRRDRELGQVVGARMLVLPQDEMSSGTRTGMGPGASAIFLASSSDPSPVHPSCLLVLVSCRAACTWGGGGEGVASDGPAWHGGGGRGQPRLVGLHAARVARGRGGPPPRRLRQAVGALMARARRWPGSCFAMDR
jgi:hypothetical protein